MKLCVVPSAASSKAKVKSKEFLLEANACVRTANIGHVLEQSRERHRTLLQKLFYSRLREHVHLTSARPDPDGESDAGSDAEDTLPPQTEQEAVAAPTSSVPFSGRLSASDAAVLAAHGDWCQLNNTLQDLDYFCILMEMHGHHEVDPLCIQEKLEKLLYCLPDTNELDARDQSRLVAALQAVFSSSFPQVTSPMDMYSGSNKSDRALLSAHLRSLDAIFKFDLWQTVCYTPAASERKPSIASKGDYSKGLYLIAWLQSYIKDHAHVTYLQIKPLLIEKFGEDVFESCKEQVTTVLLKNSMPPEGASNANGPPSGSPQGDGAGTGAGAASAAVSVGENSLPRACCCGGDAVSCTCGAEDGSELQAAVGSLSLSLADRLTELLKACDYKDLTCSAVRQQLEREFGERAVAASKRSISVAVIHELNARWEHREAMPRLVTRRELKQELRRTMTTRCATRYHLVRELAKPALDASGSEYEGFEIVWAVRFVRTLQADMEACKALCTAYEEIMPGFQLSSVVFRAYDKLVAGELRRILAKHEPHAHQDSLPTVFFELYFAIHAYWQSASAELPGETLADVELRDYYRWFEPFVRHWMELSKVNGCRWIRNSLNLDRSGRGLNSNGDVTLFFR